MTRAINLHEAREILTQAQRSYRQAQTGVWSNGDAVTATDRVELERAVTLWAALVEDLERNANVGPGIRPGMWS